jgi:tetratricopeptide (TPR) repeat protein
MKIKESLTDQYLQQKMSITEIERFNSLYHGNMERLKELQLIRTFGAWLSDPEALAFSLKVQAERNRRAKNELMKQTKIGIHFWSRWIAAAVVLLLLGVPGWLVYQHRRLSSEQIFEKYYRSVEIPVIFRGGNTDINQSLQKGLTFFNNGEYAKATKAFEEITVTFPDRPEFQLMLGAAAMENSEYDKAEASFQKVLENGTDLLAEEAEWALGFTYLLSGDHAGALKVFQEIASLNGYYSQKAEKLIKHLRN